MTGRPISLSEHQSNAAPKLALWKENQKYFVPPDDILFFETESDRIYAHTENNSDRIQYRLYKLKKILPLCFVRVSKSAIVNIRKIYLISKCLASSHLICFTGSHKQGYASRSYFRTLRLHMKRRSLL